MLTGFPLDLPYDFHGYINSSSHIFWMHYFKTINLQNFVNLFRLMVTANYFTDTRLNIANRNSTLKQKTAPSFVFCCVLYPVYKTENTAVGIRCADHATPSLRKSWH
jgi:hypothetical protein